MRNLVVPELFVDVTGVMATKLGCSAATRASGSGSTRRRGWTIILRACGKRGRKWPECPATRVAVAEGFRRHSHVGFSVRDGELLAEVLGPQAGYASAIAG